MVNSVKLSFRQQYDNYITNTLEPTRDDIRKLFARWEAPEYWSKYSKKGMPAPAPIQRVRTRIKSLESVIDKIYRKRYSYADGFSVQSVHHMSDALGARIVVYFLSGFTLIDREIRTSGLFEISPTEPPIAYLSEDLTGRLGLTSLERREKESGYASVHYVLRLKESQLPPEERPWFELQVRTLMEDTWSEIEHLLGYKPKKKTYLAVTKQFQIISRQLAAIDEHFNFLNDELSRFQEEVPQREELFNQNTDTLNPENLPAVLSELGLICAQSEVDDLLKILASRGVDEVGHLRRLATGRRLEVIRNTYVSETGELPRNFETIAVLADLNGHTDDRKQVEIIREHISIHRDWPGKSPLDD